MPVQHPSTPARDGDILPLPPKVPRVHRSRLTRWIGRTILKAGGWKMVGEFPDVPKAVLIGAPHSSNWDGVWGFSAVLALGLDLRILGKKELFWGPTVSYTHLDVYKRQPPRRSRGRSIGKPRRFPISGRRSRRCWACLLYTSRCV